MRPILLITLFILSSMTMADESKDKILKFISSNKYYEHAKEVIKEKPHTWGGILLSSEFQVQKIGLSYSGGNPMGGNGGSNTYLVVQRYSENMDWNGYEASLLIFVRTWKYESMAGSPAMEGMEISSIIDSFNNKIVSKPEADPSPR